MIQLTRRQFCGAAAASFLLSPAEGGDKATEWWERGQDTWYYKDDWKALYVSGARELRKTVNIPGAVRAAYAYVWGTGATLRVNGRDVGSDRDDGTIEDYDLRPFLRSGENVFELVRVRREAILEAGVVLESGSELTIGTDASWSDAPLKISPERRTGPRAYAGDTHCARILEITAEQKAKAAVNRLHSIRNRILDRDRYLFWRGRDPREVLTLATETPERSQWAGVETLLTDARGPLADAAAAIRSSKYDVGAILLSAIEKTERAEQAVARLIRNAEDSRSAYNRLGWVISTEPLDNDPAFWEFDIAPTGSGSIGLAGRWDFRTGGDAEQWRSIYAPSKYGWERQGITHDNYAVKGRANKPYNGLASYRKRIVVPAEWRGSELVLWPGLRGENQYWLAVNGTWVHPPEQPGCKDARVTIPATLVRFGGENVLTVRVHNGNNLGGITSPRLRLSRAGHEPSSRRSVCGAGIVRETAFAGGMTQIAFSSALSPAAVVVTSGRDIRLGNWAARGYAAPERCTFVGRNGIETVELTALRPERLRENWLLLPGDESRRPLLVVFERRPLSIHPAEDGVEFHYARPGARLLLMRPDKEDGGTARFWSRALLRYPIGYKEQLDFRGSHCDVALAYQYLHLASDWKTEALTLAPVPMLFSYALEHRWPGASVQGSARSLGCRARSGYYPQADCGEYRAVAGASTVRYRFDRMEPPIHLKGVGTLREELRIGEPLFADSEKWGCNSVRPQMYFHEMPGFFEHPDGRWNERSRLVFDERAQRVMDRLIDQHRRHGQMFIMNWFWNLDRPGNEPNQAVVNSSRYWQFAPATRQHILDFWVRMAEHCRHLPPDAVCYDLLNEPSDVYWDDYNRFIKEWTAAVRKVDPVHRLTVEAGGGWAQPEDLDLTEPTGDRNTIYQFHGYGPHTGDCHRNGLWYPRYEPESDGFRSYEEWEERLLAPIRFGIRNHCELFHGEFGISFIGPGEAPRGWVEALLSLHEKYRIHWNWWNYAGDNIHRTGLVCGERVNPLVETLSKYARMRAPQGAKEEPGAQT